MRAIPILTLLACAPLLGCGGAGDDDTASADADPFAPDADPNAPDARPPGTPDAAPAPVLPTCYQTCGTAADCATAGGPLFGADNYACEGGTCRWTGCNSTDECTAAYGSSGYVCATLSGIPFPTCYATCSTASDCATPDSPLLGADNYECDGGKCRFTGCNSTDECTATYMSSNYTCYERACWPTCSTASNCVSATSLHDADNYACNGGRCEWTGCNSTAECTDAFMSSDYVCEAQ